jgi:16S rRNA processing protein RimM
LTERVRVGRVGRPHGIGNAFVVEHPSKNESLFEPGATVLVNGEPAVVVERKRAGGRLVVQLDRSVARGAALEVPRDMLPEPEEDNYYVVDLLGSEVVDDQGQSLGRVQDVLPGVANDVLQLDSGLSLPMHEECVLNVDLGARRIVVARGFADAE